jgi:hypothetical protein
MKKQTLIILLISLFSIAGYGQIRGKNPITIVLNTAKISITEGMVYPKQPYSVIACAKLPDSLLKDMEYYPFLLYIDFEFWWVKEYLSYQQQEIIKFNWHLYLTSRDLIVRTKAFIDIKYIIIQGIESTLSIKKEQEFIFKKVIVTP